MKPSATAEFSLPSFVPYQFALLSSRLSKALTKNCAQAGLSLSEWRLMAVISSADNLSASDVADRSTMDAVAVHRAVKSLLERGFISREAVAGDRRMKRLVLTAAGNRAYSSVVPAAAALERELLSTLSPGEEMRFRRMLRKLTEARI